jgi:hypothetical protein
MKRGLLAVVVAGLALAVAVGASGAAKTVTATFTGKCTEIDTLDHNGALASARNNCSTLAKGRFAGATQLELGTFESESGTGAPGVVHGTLLVTGPQGSVTLALRGKRTYMTTSKGAPYIQETGTWTLGKVSGYPGVQLSRSGAYSTIIKTLSTVTGTKVSLVKVTGSFGCWNCGAT